MPENVEVKLRVDALEPIAARLRELGARDHGAISQVDTYFHTSAPAETRLKLREQQPGQSELIAYVRPDRPGLQASRYRICPVLDPGALKAALLLALGGKAEVVKSRHLFLMGRTRIHLDRVEGLGSFLELEVVLEPVEAGEGEAERILGALGLEGVPRIAGSYADL
jgi:adenylate cyclase class IV